jgi:hypothetical protein
MTPSQAARPDEEPIRLTYLAGISYCGSTLLSLVLNTHPEILSIGEMGPRFIPNRREYLCSCGRTTSDCEFYGEVKRRMARRGVPFDEINMFLRHSFSDGKTMNRLLAGSLRVPALTRMRDAIRDRLPSVRRRIGLLGARNEAFMRSGLQAAGKRVFLDATKDSSRIPFLQGLDVDLRVIHLVRDPRGYLYSARKRRNPSPAEAGEFWVRGHRAVEARLARVPRDRWIRLRYEEIARDPEHKLSELTRFMGAGDFTMMADFNDYPHHIVGNSMRQSSERRAQIRLDEKWRREIPESELAEVWSVAGPLAREYGYE